MTFSGAYAAAANVLFFLRVVTVIIPAYNEEAMIREAVLSVLEAAKAIGGFALEVIVVNDGSRDRTGEEADRLAREFPDVRVLHHERNMGLGASFKDGVRLAKYGRICLFPGDNAVTPYTIRNVFRHRDAAEVVVAYMLNTEVRSRPRLIISTLFNLVYCLTFGVHLKYLQGPPCLPTERLRALELRADSYNLLGEIVVKLLRSGASFAEVDGYFHSAENVRRSSALRFKTVYQVACGYLSLVADVFWRDPRAYGRSPRRVLPT